jgi:hypothetical protein
MRARISNLYRTELEWNKLSFTPNAGELVIYAADDKYAYARVKIGDGKTPLKLLPFFIDYNISSKLSEYDRESLLDAGDISTYIENIEI